MPSFPWADLHEQLGQSSSSSVHVMVLQLQVCSAQPSCQVALDPAQEHVEGAHLADAELSELIESVPSLLAHTNPKVLAVIIWNVFHNPPTCSRPQIQVQRDALHILHIVILKQGDSFRRFISHVLGPVVASMGESASPVRTEAIALMVAFLQQMGASSFTTAIDSVWSDKNWRVRQGMAQVFGAAAGQFRLPKLTIRERDAVLGRLVTLLEDSNRCALHLAGTQLLKFQTATTMYYTHGAHKPPTNNPQQRAGICAGLHRDHGASYGLGGQADRAPPQCPTCTHAGD